MLDNTPAFRLRNKVKETADLIPNFGFHAHDRVRHACRTHTTTHSLRLQLFTVPFPLTLTATGASSLANWQGSIPSRTDLLVPSGGTFTLNRCGDISSTSTNDSLRWDSTTGNTADIDGSTLSVDHSFAIFTTGATPTITGGVVTEGMVVRNGGTLNISGSDSSIEYARLIVDGGLLIDSSTLQLADRGHLSVPTGKLVLNNATVNFLDDTRAAAVNADVVEFQGTTTINATNPLGYQDAGLSAGFGLANGSTVVNIAGTGPTFADGIFVLIDGTVNVAAGASLDLRSTTGVSAAQPSGNVNIASTGELAIGPNFQLFTNSMNLHNEGTVSVSGDLLGGGTLSGQGNVVVDGSNALLGVASSQSTFTIDGNLSFLTGSTLGLIVDPSAGTSQHVSVADLSINTPFNIPTTNLLLTLNNDTVLADGTKFLLVDYDTLTAGEHFIGFADGSTFTQGLNSYQIRYSDAAYSALNPSVITLTVVPEPSTWLLAALGAVAGVAHTQLRRRRRGGLADLVPPPRKHRHRYHGVFAPNHPLRPAVTALAIGNIGKRQEAAADGHATDGHGTGGCCDSSHEHQRPRSHDTSRIAWAKLMARVGEEFPLECPACGGDIRLIAFITEPGPIRKILTHLGEPLVARPPTGASSSRPMTTVTPIRRRPTSCPRSTSTASDRSRTQGTEALAPADWDPVCAEARKAPLQRGSGSSRQRARAARNARSRWL